MATETTRKPTSSFSSLLSGYLGESVYSYRQLSRLSGVPQRTIVNWLDHSTRRPRRWQDVARLAHALRLSDAETDALLRAADLPTLRTLHGTVCEPSDLAILAHWPPSLQVQSTRPLPDVTDETQAWLRRYCGQVIATHVRLDRSFPPGAPFTFEEIFQEPEVRSLHRSYTHAGKERTRPSLLDGDTVPWAALRDHLRRAVIVGQPGSGKSWLLRHEAIRLARIALAANGAPVRIPFLLSLADLAAHLTLPVMPDQVLRAIALQCAIQTVGRPEPALVATLLSFLTNHPEQAVFLLDGALGPVDYQDRLGAARRGIQLLADATTSAIFVTVRPLGYAVPFFALGEDASEAELELLPLREGAITRIVRGWHHDQPARSEAFMERLRGSPELAGQAANPQLLHAYCRLLGNLDPSQLPQTRELQRQALDWMLQQGEELSGVDAPGSARRQQKLLLLERLAWQLATYRGHWHWHLTGETLEGLLDELPEAQALAQLSFGRLNGYFPGLLWELSEQDGLLVKGELSPDGLASAVPYAFLHRSLHTFLVAQYLIRQYLAEGTAAAELDELAARGSFEPEWSGVITHLVAYVVTEPQPETHALCAWLCERVCGKVGRASRSAHFETMAALWKTQLLSAPSCAANVQVDLSTLAVQLTAALRSTLIPAQLRVAAGRALNRVGDPRRTIMEVDALEFAAVEAGYSVLGSDPAHDRWSRADERPAQRLWLPEYRISRFPVSQAQFVQFLADKPNPYEVADYWPEAIHLGHWRPGEVLRATRWYGADGVIQPVMRWNAAPEDYGWPYHLPNHPICGIGWYEARAFARWLARRWHASGRLLAQEELDLPTEAEWEKAARGAQGWIYPWGNEMDFDRLAGEGQNLMAAAPIGAFPTGVSPYGVEGLSGNLYEWTYTVYRPYRIAEDSQTAGQCLPERGLLQPDDRPALRGGAHFDTADRCRAACRRDGSPVERLYATVRLVIRRQG